MSMRGTALVLAAAMSLGLAACDRARQDTGDMTAGKESPAGTTGKSGSGGTNAMGAGPGTGLNGGLNSAPGQRTDVPNGSPNGTAKSSVGNR